MAIAVDRRVCAPRLRDGRRQSISQFDHGARARHHAASPPKMQVHKRHATLPRLQPLPPRTPTHIYGRKLSVVRGSSGSVLPTPLPRTALIPPEGNARLRCRLLPREQGPTIVPGVGSIPFPICRTAPKRFRIAPRAAPFNRASMTSRQCAQPIYGRLRAMHILIERWPAPFRQLDP